jgi:phenolic acid decarboxylase
MYRCGDIARGTTLRGVRTTNIWQLEETVSSLAGTESTGAASELDVTAPENMLVGLVYRPTQGA